MTPKARIDASAATTIATRHSHNGSVTVGLLPAAQLIWNGLQRDHRSIDRLLSTGQRGGGLAETALVLQQRCLRIGEPRRDVRDHSTIVVDLVLGSPPT